MWEIRFDHSAKVWELFHVSDYGVFWFGCWDTLAEAIEAKEREIDAEMFESGLTHR